MRHRRFSEEYGEEEKGSSKLARYINEARKQMRFGDLK